VVELAEHAIEQVSERGVGHCRLGGFLRRYGLGLIGRAGFPIPFQAAVAVPVIWFQVVNRSVIRGGTPGQIAGAGQGESARRCR